MELNRDTYDLICEQLNQCLLPELDRDIGNEPLEKEDFGIFRYGLEMNLQLLFDIIAKNERILLEPFDDDNTFRVNFLLLVHQQSGHDEAPFQTDSHSISKQIRLLTEKYYKKLISTPDIHKRCLQYYKDRLTADKWKRNIGAVYGFLQMNKLHQQLIESKLKSDECLFMLSVGMLLVDYFEMIYKKFGFILFNILLSCGNANELKTLNLYEVVFKKMTPLCVVRDEETTALLLSCIYKCINKFDGWKNPSKWNQIDDVLDEILKRIPMESDIRCVCILFLFVAKITTLPMKTPQIFNRQTDFENLDQVIVKVEKLNEAEQSQQCDELRSCFHTYHNLLIARWSKKLLEVFAQREIIGQPKEIRHQIHAMHLCYLSCFYGNPLFIQMKWAEFLSDVTKNLTQLVTNNVNHDVFLGEVFHLLITFKRHLEAANLRASSLEPLEHDLDSLKISEHEQICSSADASGDGIGKFIENIDSIITEIKLHCKSK